MGYKVLGLYAGNGVSLYPFLKKSKKFEIIGNVESRSLFKTPDNIQWKLNFGKIPCYDKIESVYEKNITIIIGHPDCGHSSVLSYSRKKKLSDPLLNKSFRGYIEGINYLKPKIFLFENLDKIFKMLGEDFFKKQFPNYNLKNIVTSVSAFGNSQIHRNRLVMIGIRKDYPKRLLKKFKVVKTYDLKTTVDLIGDLEYPNPDLCHIRESDDKVVCMEYKGKKLNLREVRELWNTEFSAFSRWPMFKKNMKTLPGVYKNLEFGFPSTVRKQNRQFNHEGDSLTPREMGRIQGIPDSFKIWFNEKRKEYCINKGRVTVTKTPPYEIGKWFRDKVTKTLTSKHYIPI